MTTNAPEEEHVAEESDFKPLTAQEAAEWRQRHPPVSVVRVVKWQLVVGVVLTVLVGLVTQRAGWMWSVAYGAAAVVIPAAFLHVDCGCIWGQGKRILPWSGSLVWRSQNWC